MKNQQINFETIDAMNLHAVTGGANDKDLVSPETVGCALGGAAGASAGGPWGGAAGCIAGAAAANHLASITPEDRRKHQEAAQDSIQRRKGRTHGEQERR